MKNDPIALAQRVQELQLQLKICLDEDADFDVVLRIWLELREVVKELEGELKSK